MAGVVPGTGLTYLLAIDGVSGSVTDPSHPGVLGVSPAKLGRRVKRVALSSSARSAAPALSGGPFA